MVGGGRDAVRDVGRDVVMMKKGKGKGSYVVMVEEGKGKGIKDEMGWVVDLKG